MSNMSDNEFIRSFSTMIIGMACFSVVIFIIAQIVGDYGKPKPDQAKQKRELAERIKPVGQLTVKGGAVMGNIISTAHAAAPANGQKIYNNSCAACHATGAAGAPKYGDKPAWGNRLTQSAKTLYDHAIKGFQGKTGYMPPKGGAMHLSDAEVKAAVDYMTKAVK